ncbi:MAG: hypothetical protein EOM04_07170 [Clostridia bacterium]|nr:hypothetical protein [Clostridia bacterium]
MDEKELKVQQDPTDKKETKKKKVEEVVEDKEPDYKLMSPWLRFTLLKAEIRGISLEKEEAGYKSQYFYVSLQDMQKVFTTLELKYFLTSVYTEETRLLNPGIEGAGVSTPIIKNIVKRDLIDILTGELITSTEIDITNLKQITDPYELKNEILRIAEPKDAWKTLYLDFFEPQNLGAISTYFQRYTYNQLYDFQETKEDKIEKKGKLDKNLVLEEGKKKDKKETKKEEATPKDKRLQDDAAELRSQIKKEFVRDDIVKELNGRKLGTMTLEEAQQFYKDLEEKYTKKESESEE